MKKARLLLPILTLFSLVLTSYAQTPQPDWAARYKELKAFAERDFVPKKIGDEIRITLTIGGDKTGTLSAISNGVVVLLIAGKQEVFQRTRLTPDSRMVLFADDYAQLVAKKKLDEEKKAYQSEQDQMAKANAEKERELDRQRVEAEARQKELQQQAEQREAKAKLASAHLVLSDWHWSEEYGYVTVEGQVGNITGKKLQNVEAVASFYAADGTFITSDSALVEYNPLMPGQVSPFKVMKRHNPMMKKASVTFKVMWGSTLTTISKAEYEKGTKQ